MRIGVRAWFVAACFSVVACGDTEPALKLPSRTTTGAIAGSGNGSPGTELVAKCDGAPDGTPCGEAGSRTYCVFDACIENVCGDGMAKEGEECDDGNQRDHDGCDSRCRLEPPPGCGNGVLEAGEECDDGNTDDDDQCTHLCMTARCGDGIVSRGEECDDANLNDKDSCSSRCQKQGSDAGTDGTGGAESASGTGGQPSSGDGTGTGGSDGTGTGGNDGTGTGGSNGTGTGGSSGTGTGGSSGTGTGGSNGTGTGGSNGTGTGGSDGTGTGGTGTGGSDGTGTGGTDGTGTGGTDGTGTGGTDGTGTGGSGGDGTGGDGTGGTSASPCDNCRAMNCADYLGTGIDVYAGCFLSVNEVDGADATDPTFLQHCIDAFNCSYAHDCAYKDPYADGRGAIDCYCGTASFDDCSTTGPASDAACAAEWQAAAQTTTSSLVLLRMTQSPSAFKYPSGWANFLLECDRDYCNDTASGKCTP